MANEAIYVWLILTIVIALFVTATVWSRSRSTWRLPSVAGLFLASPMVFAGLVYVLGWPLPKALAITLPSGDYAILGTKMVVGEGIYVLLDEGGIPRYYAFPWDKAMSDKMQELLDSEGGKEGMRMKLPPFEFSWEMRKPPEVYALPQPKVLPDKPRQEEEPQRFDSI
jgi:hypothetical protein